MSLFPEAEVKDRRGAPNHGYRAVHLIVEEDSLLLEVQIRTRLQHFWANTTERLADAWGRGIRYGAPPVGGDPLEVAQRIAGLGRWMEVARCFGELEDAFGTLLRGTNGEPVDRIDAEDLDPVSRRRYDAAHAAAFAALLACPPEVIVIANREGGLIVEELGLT